MRYDDQGRGAVSPHTRPFESLGREGRHALRRLVRDWPFSAAAIGILALGIGANTTVFSVLNNTLFVPHPFTDSGRLVNIYQNDARSGEPEGVSFPAFLDFEQETGVYSGLAATMLSGIRYEPVTGAGTRGAIRNGLVEFASENFLAVVGMQPALGRWFSSEEERRADPVVVLGWTVWQREYNADPNLLGQTMIVGGKPFEVIGVGPQSLHSSQSDALVVNLWMPLSHIWRGGSTAEAEPVNLQQQRRQLSLLVRARLREGITLQQAQAAMDVTARRLAAQYPEADPGRGITVLATDDVRVHPGEKRLAPVFAAGLLLVGLVLAIACSNLATLLLVRASARSSEIAIRLALGAARWQLVRQLLVESMILSLIGGAAGVALTFAGIRYLQSIDLPIILSLQIDYRVLGFAIGIALLCALGFGLSPALRATRVDVIGGLREESGASARGFSLAGKWLTLKNGLVTGQVAASFLLLVAAAMALGVLTATQARSVGYRPEGVAFVVTDPRYADYDLPRATSVLEALRSRVSALPGVESAFVTSEFPIDSQFEREFRVQGAGEAEIFKVEGRYAGLGYFQTMKIPVLFGRVFNEHDTPDSPEVVVVSEAFARRYFGTSNAVGRRIRYEDEAGTLAEVIGVVGNARSIDFVEVAPKRLMYRSEKQCRVMPTTVVARTAGDEMALAGLMQREVRRVHPELPVTTAMTMKQRQEMELMLFRVAALSLGSLGCLGLLLAAVGLYAVVAYAVAQRSRELGIRIALGARADDVLRLVLRDVTGLILAGIAVGGGLAGAGITLLASSPIQIAGVSQWAVVSVALLILACGATAACIPARRAILTDPMSAIRHQ